MCLRLPVPALFLSLSVKLQPGAELSSFHFHHDQRLPLCAQPLNLVHRNHPSLSPMLEGELDGTVISAEFSHHGPQTTKVSSD